MSLWNVGRAGARRSQVDGQHRSRSQRDAPSTPQRPHVCKALASWEEPAGGQYRRGGLASLSLRSRKADGTFWGGGGRPPARVSDDRPVMAALAMYGSQSLWLRSLGGGVFAALRGGLVAAITQDWLQVGVAV